MIRKLFRLALCLAALAAMAWACEKPEPFDANTSVVLRSAELETEGGNAFVSVTCNGDWTLSLAFSDGGGWATVTPSSGSGSKNNIQRKEGEAEDGALKVRFTKIIRDVVEGEMEVPSAIEGVQNNANVSVAKRQFFNASGVELSQPVRGINIVRETLSDGTVRSHKVVIK
jgi:hypothetical protein